MTSALVVLVLVAAGLIYAFDLGGRRFGQGSASPLTEPALVLPPAGLALPPARRPAPVAPTTASRPVDGAAVARALTPLARSRVLGRHVVVQVATTDGTVVYRHGTGVVTPASTLKILTAVAALRALGPAHRFTTSVVAGGGDRVVLVGGGDPLLARAPGVPGGYPARADLVTLAHRTVTALRREGRSRVRLGYDTSAFSGPEVDPHWPAAYLPEAVVSRISPLWVDEGRRRPGLEQRVTDPALSAATVFAKALTRRGIRVVGRVAPAVAPTRSGQRRILASVRSARLDQIVAYVLQVSDNEGAEVLARQVAVARGEPGSFAGGAAAVRSELRGLGVDLTGLRTYDGSGLSRQDRLAPATLLQVLHTAASAHHPGLRTAVVDLPVAGFTGSLAHRFDSGDRSGPGLVRAKTGTLTGVHGLTGTVTTANGSVLLFVAIADRVQPADTLDARTRLDRLAAALAGCRCG